MHSFIAEPGLSFPSIYLSFLKEEKTVGNYLLVPHSEHMWEIHLSPIDPKDLLFTIKIGKEAMEFVFDNIVKVEKLIAIIPINNKYACLLAEKSGMLYEGIIKKGAYVEDEMIDLKIYGICRDEI